MSTLKETRNAVSRGLIIASNKYLKNENDASWQELCKVIANNMNTAREKMSVK